MRCSAVVLALSVAGCRFFLGDDHGTVDGNTGPGSDGSGSDAAALCGGSLLTSPVCLASAPTAPLALSTTIDTGGTSCRPYTGGGGDFCVLAGTDVTVGSGTTVAVIGTRPLIVFATGTITIDGAIDAASHVRGATGAGAMTTGCNAYGTSPGLRGGGAGASVGGNGGRGGDAGTQNGSGTNFGAGGLPASTLAFSFRGGCTGQSVQNAGNGYGAGGAGGGAVYLIAHTRIDVTATGGVDASGAAGTGGRCLQNGGTCSTNGGTVITGGGGGGAGGTIALEATEVTVAGKVFADGGGGGEGASGSTNGADGSDPSGTAAAGGGNTLNNSGPGGTGAHVPANDGTAGGNGSSSTQAPGGGGGGGGAGFVRIIATTRTTPGTISPPAP